MGQFLGAWLQVEIWEDQSKYGMPVPEELQELFDFDPAIEKAFENLLPGKRRQLPPSNCLGENGSYPNQTGA